MLRRPHRRGEGPRHQVRRLHGRRRPDLRCSQGRDIRLPGPERRREDDHDARHNDHPAPDLRDGADRRPRRVVRLHRGSQAHRDSAAAHLPGQGPHGPPEHQASRHPAQDPPVRAGIPHRLGSAPPRTGGLYGPHRGQPLRRMEAPCGDSLRDSPRAGAPAPGRIWSAISTPAGPRYSSPPTTSRRPSPCATGSRSSTTAGWWPSGPWTS